MPKPPNRGGAESQALPKPAHHTRSVTQTTANGKPTSQQSISRVSSAKDQQKDDPTVTVANDVATAAKAEVITTSIVTMQPIVEGLNKILSGEESPERVIKGILKYIRKLEKTEKEDEERREIQMEVSALRKGINKDVGMLHDSLMDQLNYITSTLDVTRENSEKALKASEELKGETCNILNKLGNVTSVADKIAVNTQSYRDALVTRQSPTHKASVDPKVLGDIDRKAKQILVDIYDEEGANTMEKSLTELMAKANEVLDGMTDADKPTSVKVEAAFKSQKNAILLTLNSKEAARWVKEIGNEETFANAFSKGAHIREREYSLIAPRVPLTFEPENQAHLREIEEANSLPTRIIRKARWIKPASRRRVGQTNAYAILVIASVDIANKVIKDGLGICGSLIRPTKQKQEPIQCMKCRRWGHFADKCLGSEDICGTCGGKHRTNVCSNSGKRHCVSCDADSHASWDRSCPEFIRRCEAMDQKNPVNSMPFFPAEQDWTLASRPNRIPLVERFPAAYAVNSLPVPGNRNAQRKKGPNRTGKSPQSNPNLIPVPAKNKYGDKEPGELADDEEGIPAWLREPIDRELEYENTDGDVTQRLDSWI